MTRTSESLDHNEAVDPVLEAFDRVEQRELLGETQNRLHTADLLTIRKALADRISPTEAALALDWVNVYNHEVGVFTATERELITRLRKTEEQDR
jgi:hypothetical protein